uniref:NEJ1 protein n=1 Tax=Saccharomyces mikatae TaxID=114525 RepID=Q0P6Y9_SACMI|nr:NEJ1 protein [Saccharomyces mikatae]
MMDPEYIERQLKHSTWFVKRINGEGNCLVTFLPMRSSSTILVVVLVSLNHLMPSVFKLTQTQLSQQCQSQGFTDNTSLDQIKLKLMDILRCPQKINQIELTGSNLNLNFNISPEITISIKIVPSHVTKDTCSKILQNLSMLLLKLINFSAQYQSIQQDILNEKQQCLDYLLRSLNDLDGGSKIIRQWAPENSRNYESLQPSTCDDIIKKLHNRGKCQDPDSPADSLTVLLCSEEKFQDISQIEESEESIKEGARFPGAKDLYDDDFELQLEPSSETQPKSYRDIKPTIGSNATIANRNANSLLCPENFPEYDSTSSKRTKPASVVSLTSSPAGERPRKKRRFGKIKIKN